MTCTNGRASLADVDQRFLFSEAAGFCQRCGTSLFVELGERRLTIAEMAHIVAAREAGPRGASPLSDQERDSVENIILLCPTCHAVVDKAPEAFPVEMVAKWKTDRRRMLEAVVGVGTFATRTEARASLQRILAENHTIFDAYGPESESAKNLDGEGGRAWHRKVIESILPNNRRLLATFDVNQDLLNDDERRTVEEFRQHVDDLEARHLGGHVEPGAHRFPHAVEEVFTDDA